MASGALGGIDVYITRRGLNVSTEKCRDIERNCDGGRYADDRSVVFGSVSLALISTLRVIALVGIVAAGTRLRAGKPARRRPRSFPSCGDGRIDLRALV